MGFRYVRQDGGVANDHTRADVQLAASQTVAVGDALTVSNGELTVATSSTTQIDAIAAEAAVSGTTDIVKPACYPARGEKCWEVGFTPLHDNVTASGGSTTTAVIAQAGYSGNEVRYGFMYLHGTRELRRISASSATSGGNITLTTEEPFSRAVVNGDKISTVPFGIEADPKLATKATLSSAVADATGGPVRVKKVDMLCKKAIVKMK